MRKRLDALHSTWPGVDRAAWDALCGSRRYFGRWKAAKWRTETKRQAEYAYDRWLRFLGATKADALNWPPVDRLENGSLGEFIEHLARGTRGKPVSNRTMATTINHFINALRAIVPDYQPVWLMVRMRQYERRARRDTRAVPTTTIQDLKALARNLMNDAPMAAHPLDAARRYRDGLILELLLATTLRRRSLLSLAVGRSLRRTGDTYRIVITGEHTKENRPINRSLDPRLTPYIDRYLTEYRPRFPRASTTDCMWLSSKGGALGASEMSALVGRRTEARGERLAPHQFRHLVATAVATSPIGVKGASQLLQHANPTMTAGKYCRGDTLRASRELGRVIDTVRRRRELLPLSLPPTSPHVLATKGIEMN